MSFSEDSKRLMLRGSRKGAALLLPALLMFGMPAFGQETTRQPAVTDHIEDIVVTARRRAENLQTVPISVTAISAAKFERQSITTDKDLLTSIPSVGVHSQHPDTTYIAIRGQDGKGAVVLYQNEVPLVTQGPDEPYGVGVGGPAMLYDMENVQVLKGPQGTLFGRNTTGGAVLYQTKRPTDQWGGSIAAEYGNYNSREFTGVLNGPLVNDKLLVRVAATLVQRDGYVHVLSEPSHPNGIDVNNRNAYSVRGTITMKPSDNFQNDLIVQYMHNKNNGEAQFIKAYDPTFAGGFINLLYPNLPAMIAQQNALGPRTSIPLSTDTSFDAQFWTATDIMKFEVNDNITLRNIANYSQEKIFNFAADGDGTSYNICDCIDSYLTPQVDAQLSEEFQVQGKSFNNNLVWTTGLFLITNPAQTGFNVQDQYFFGGRAVNYYRFSQNSKAIYAQGTYDLSSMVEGLKVTGGIRYTWDHIFDSARKNVPAPDSCPASLLATLNNADALCTQSAGGSFHAPTWTIGLDYQLNSKTLLYVTSRRGYRQGGVNIGAATASYATYQPEHVTDVEAGIKADWTLGGANIRTNAALFREWYSNIQAENLEPGTGTSVGFVTRNGPSAVISGGEFEAIIQPVQNVELGATVSYLNSDYNLVGVDAAAAAELRNDILQDKPKWKYNLNATYHLPVPESVGDISLSAVWDYQSTTRLVKSAPDHPWDTQRGYGLLNLNVTWDEITGRPLSATFFMNNATDKVYASGSFALRPVLGFASVAYGEPRMFGVKLKYKFGGEAN